MILKILFFLLVFINFNISFLFAEDRTIIASSISMHGEPLLNNNFQHLNYANPNSNIGGSFRMASLGTFDSTNPFIIKGRSAYGIRDYVFESLLSRDYSKPFTLRSLIAEKIHYSADRTWIEFFIDDAAEFSDGIKIKPKDILFSFNALKENGRPNHRSYYSRVKNVIITSDKSIKFITDNKEDRELILIIGMMPILPEHIYGNERFKEAKLDIPIGSGPYIVSKIEQGRNITYSKNTTYWGKQAPINNGLHNFDNISVDYYLDDNSRFEAFKAGLFDFYQIWDPTRWNNLKNHKNVHSGKIKLLEIERKTPAGMLGLAMNTRKPNLSNIEVRKALTILFDFNWINNSLYHNLYNRTEGFFDNSYLSSINQPIDDFEKILLGDSLSSLDKNILSGKPYDIGKDKREILNIALKLFEKANYKIENGQLINITTKEPFILEFLITDKRQEKYAINYMKNLERIGIKLNIKMVDSTQYQKRKQNFDFDIIEHFWYSSLSPGNEQNFYWGTESASQIGSRNYPGITSNKIDNLIQKIVSVRKIEEFTYSVRALDRMLISGYYVIPLFHWPHQWVAVSNKINYPEKVSLDGYKTNSWYIGD
jgi:peptide/nickel transport system substrate-binding protein